MAPSVRDYLDRIRSSLGSTLAHVEAAALLRACSSSRIELPVSEQDEWYAAGGRYWVLCWAVCGWERDGDAWAKPDAFWWTTRLPTPQVERLWSELYDLADTSDAWLAQQKHEATPLEFSIAPLLHKSIDWSPLFSFRPIWKPIWKNTTRKTLAGWIATVKSEWTKWRKTRQGQRPPLPPPMPSVDLGFGWVLLLGLAAIALGRRRR